MAPGAKRATASLVVAEIALAVVLLAGAGLTLISFGKLLAVDPGFTPAGVLTVEFALPDGRYDATTHGARSMPVPSQRSRRSLGSKRPAPHR